MNQPAPCLFCDDCLETMSKMDAEIVDAVVTDPPYALTGSNCVYKFKRTGSGNFSEGREAKRRGFMGKEWDGMLPGEDFWREALRLAKPGAHLLAFGGTRTFHRLACAIEDAGWEIRDSIGDASECQCGCHSPLLAWVYGSGFPKSLNGEWGGTALKPAWEPIIMARKPLIGTVAQNVQRYGTGGLNVDGCRIGTSKDVPASVSKKAPSTCYGRFAESGETPGIGGHDPNLGRWPANLVLDEQAAAMLDEQSGERHSAPFVSKSSVGVGDLYTPGDYTGRGFTDSGGASRFFYCAKASRSEREEGIDGDGVTGAQAVDRNEGTAGLQSPRTGAGRTASHVRNHHPTVKPVSLMRWLVRLVCPAGGTVLDPFMGSGTTGIAAHLEGCKFIGIEKEREYFDIACDRIDEHSRQGALFA